MHHVTSTNSAPTCVSLGRIIDKPSLALINAVGKQVCYFSEIQFTVMYIDCIVAINVWYSFVLGNPLSV